jgi:peptidyl-prolyl cis-trans isomerase SurA
MRRSARFHSVLYVAVSGLVVLSAGCGGLGSKAPAPDVWAVVDGHEIHQDDVVKTYRREAQQVPASTTDDAAMMAEFGVIDEMITQAVLLDRAKVLKLDVTDAEVEAAYTTRKANMTEDQFQQALRERSVTPDDLRAALRRDLTVQKVIEHEVSSKVDVTDRDIADYFASHRAEFNVPETQFHIAQILITPVRDPVIRNRRNDDATTPDEAKRKFEMLKGQLNAGTPFAQLAADYSEDPQTAPQGGDLGFISATQLSRVPSQLRDVILKTTPGNVGAATAGGGYTLVAVLSREDPGQRDLSMPGVHDTIKTNLHDRKEQLLRVAYLTSMRNSAKVVNYLAERIVAAQSKAPSVAPGAPGK